MDSDQIDSPADSSFSHSDLDVLHIGLWAIFVVSLLLSYTVDTYFAKRQQQARMIFLLSIL